MTRDGRLQDIGDMLNEVREHTGSTNNFSKKLESQVLSPCGLIPSRRGITRKTWLLVGGIPRKQLESGVESSLGLPASDKVKLVP